MTQTVLRSIHNAIEEAVSMRKTWKPVLGHKSIDVLHAGCDISCAS